jgi:enoyl-CoA hydratase
LPIRLEPVSEGVVLLTIDREASMNALDHPHVAELHERLQEIESNRAHRVVVITGTGRAFCAGLDLKDAGLPPDSEGLGLVQGGLLWQQHFSKVISRMRSMRAVTIAAVNGAAIGAGFGLALATETRIAGPGARFSVANVTVGLSGCDIGTSYHLPKVVGLTRAAELMFTGRIIGAEEADKIGIVLSVAQDPVAEAVALAERIAGNSPFGVAMTKQVMWQNVDAPSLQAALELEDRTNLLAGMTLDSVEAMKAFVERRPPTYKNI